MGYEGMKKINVIFIWMLSSLLAFTSFGSTLTFATGSETNSTQVEELSEFVEQGFYSSVEEAEYWENLNDLEYDSIVDKEQDLDELSVMDETEVFIEHERGLEYVYDNSESTLFLHENTGKLNLIGLDPVEMQILPFILPAVYAIVIRQGGKLVVKQFFKSSTGWITIRNGSLAGKAHPITGVKFDLKGFPNFNSQYTMTLANSLLKSTNTTQFIRANSSLKSAFNSSSTVRNKFNLLQKLDISNGKTPRGYVWHHHQTRGVLQLVNKTVHDKTGHTGGRAIWGSMYQNYSY